MAATAVKPTVDARLNNSAFYDVTRFDLVVGVEADLTLMDWPGPSRWISENDPVLEIKHAPGNDAHLIAKEIGESTIFIIENTAFGEAPKVIKEILIRVLASIQPLATTLNSTLAGPIQKT